MSEQSTGSSRSGKNGKVAAPGTSSLDRAMQEAVEAVEEVERKAASRKNNKKAKKASSASSEKKAAAEAPAKKAPAAKEPAKGKGKSGEVEELRQQVASLKEASVRTLADFDNFRKRSEREKQDVRRYALLEPMREFLPVVDNLERALAAGGRVEDLKVGVEMILKQMQDLLQRFGVQGIEAVGEKFDPTMHEAVSQEEDPEVQQPTVREEMLRGYRMHDRLLRPSMVKVAMPARSEETKSEGEA